MYKGTTTIRKDKTDLSNYIDGYDVYNSVLVDKLRDPNIQRVSYTITSNEYRPDLIAKDIYDDVKYTGILIFTCSLPISAYVRGTVLQVIPKGTLISIFNSI